ncbi:MAG TPA: hypothetical protein VM432_04935 [Bdellovibrionales bacterium]|nr:hypothetical protein [Bdellovibrionales bacterium]
MRSPSVFRLLLILAALLVSAMSWAESSRGRVAVIITLTDPSITAEESQRLGRAIDDLLPDTRIEVITLNPLTRGNLRNALETELSQRIANDEVISQVILESHGAFSKLLQAGLTSHVGMIGNGWLSPGMKSFLAPIKARIAKDAGIMFYACQTLSQNEDTARGQVSALMNYLGATEGSFFGATNNMITLPQLVQAKNIEDFAEQNRIATMKHFTTKAFWSTFALASVLYGAHFVAPDVLTGPVFIGILMNSLATAVARARLKSTMQFIRDSQRDLSEELAEDVQQAKERIATGSLNHGYLVKMAYGYPSQTKELTFSLATIPEALGAQMCRMSIGK